MSDDLLERLLWIGLVAGVSAFVAIVAIMVLRA